VKGSLGPQTYSYSSAYLCPAIALMHHFPMNLRNILEGCPPNVDPDNPTVDTLEAWSDERRATPPTSVDDSKSEPDATFEPSLCRDFRAED
jgi:hypothetical protein